MYKMYKKYPAQGSLEYGLIAGLIGVVAVAALLTLGNQVDLMMNILPGSRKASELKLQAAGQSYGSTADLPLSSNQPRSISLSNGKVIDMPGMPGLAEQVVTVGVNGATSKLLGNLEFLIDQLKQAGEITPVEADALTRLANQGYRIARIERILEESAASNKGGQAFRNTTVNFDGNSYTILDLQEMIGYQNLGPSELTDPLGADAKFAHPETAVFIELYQSAQSMGILENQDIKGYISDLTTEIIFLSEVTDDGIWRIINEAEESSRLRELAVSEITHLDSGRICDVSSGRTNGQDCRS